MALDVLFVIMTIVTVSIELYHITISSLLNDPMQPLYPTMLVTLISRNKSSLAREDQLKSIVPLTVLEAERFLPRDHEGGKEHIPTRGHARRLDSEDMKMQEFE